MNSFNFNTFGNNFSSFKKVSESEESESEESESEESDTSTESDTSESNIVPHYYDRNSNDSRVIEHLTSNNDTENNTNTTNTSNTSNTNNVLMNKSPSINNNPNGNPNGNPNNTTRPRIQSTTQKGQRKDVLTMQQSLNIQKTTSDLIVIDSYDRNDKYTTPSNHYIYNVKKDVKQKIKSITEIELVESYIKNTSYNINHYNNIMRININVFDKKRDTDIIENIIVPPGNYYQDDSSTNTNLDTKLNEILSLYNEFKYIQTKFNNNSEKYYIYQTYSHIILEKSDIYNLFLNFGEAEGVIDPLREDKTPSISDNRLFNTITPPNPKLTIQEKKYTKHTIGKYMGFNPEYYSSYNKHNIHSIKYFTEQDSNSNDEYKLKITFSGNDSENTQLFYKLYELFTWAQDDMFVAFKLNSTWSEAATALRSKTYLILKLFSGFSTNIITHLSKKETTDAAEANGGRLFIQITLKNALHQWPEYNVLALPLVTNENETNAVIGNEIITPIISDYSYRLHDDMYMLLYLRCGNTQLSRLNSNNRVIHQAFCQFRTERERIAFKASEKINTHIFSTPLAELGNITIECKDRDGEYFDLNNKNHSFTLKVTHLNNPRVLKDYQK